ncbi:TadA family conjugal transfer-associated ATPase [Aestuariimicrobium sp. p3-SID1156]|uniref:TadA family conjugal transfer-associated ATPase n=1 Tax=Aestuariimicrobium sp. p3-SID1156 TaxID=2916038 RepID=UPI00223B95AC|nr:TadA family conjugal transfer-associated ATPase [Aestuariimicrobium sp. p3-SID1156]MCT1458560.1 TadA family conjugal transfer-associated ATPase [Aestuariimicrobium sp. p3-SID1156]
MRVDPTMAADLEGVRVRLAALGRSHQPEDVAAAMREQGMVVTDSMVVWVLEMLRHTSIGAGPLDPLLSLPGVTDVLVNGADEVWIDRGQGLERTSVRFADEEEVRRLATRLAANAGRRLDESSPWVDARMGDGTRVHAVLPALASPGTCISLRVPSRRQLSLEDWREGGGLDAFGESLLSTLVEQRAAFLVSGGTGSGKTTLLSTILGAVPATERIVVVEDSRELTPAHPHVVRLEARLANAEGAGAVSLTVLVRQALRMRPDRLVVGEVRGAEICDLLTAMNTGHEGGCGTIHANSVADVPARLEALAALGHLSRDACHAQALAALDLVLHVARWPDGRRRLTQVGLVTGEVGSLHIETAVEWGPSGVRRGSGWEALKRRWQL